MPLPTKVAQIKVRKEKCGRSIKMIGLMLYILFCQSWACQTCAHYLRRKLLDQIERALFLGYELGIYRDLPEERWYAVRQQLDRKNAIYMSIPDDKGHCLLITSAREFRPVSVTETVAIEPVAYEEIESALYVATCAHALDTSKRIRTSRNFPRVANEKKAKQVGPEGQEEPTLIIESSIRPVMEAMAKEGESVTHDVVSETSEYFMPSCDNGDANIRKGVFRCSCGPERLSEIMAKHGIRSHWQARVTERANGKHEPLGHTVTASGIGPSGSPADRAFATRTPTRAQQPHWA